MGLMAHIDLFSGIGGFALAARWAGFKTVCFVEIEPYAQEIIKQNFGAVADAEYGSVHNGTWNAGREGGQWTSERSITGNCRPRIYGDIRGFDGTRYRGATLLTGGFPCQPFSQAGLRKGAADDRALWPEMFRVIREARPDWVVGENVAGFVTMELDNCISDLEREGYAVQPLIIPACAVDARHRRDRVWIVGHAARNEQRGLRRARIGIESAGALRNAGLKSENVADTEDSNRRRSDRTDDGGRRDTQARRRGEQSGGFQHWLPEPDVGRVANGIPRRVDRLKGLGNAIVPQVAYEILRVIAESIIIV